MLLNRTAVGKNGNKRKPQVGVRGVVEDCPAEFSGCHTFQTNKKLARQEKKGPMVGMLRREETVLFLYCTTLELVRES